MHQLPKLDYAYDSLEPYIDSETMELHHGKHHKGYVDKLNAALEKYPSLQKLSVEELLKRLNKTPEDVRAAARNQGGGHYNHSFFWQIIGPRETAFAPTEEAEKKLSSQFESLAQFKNKFSESAASLFDSGWTWLVKNGGKLEIINTANQDSPLMNGLEPLLAIDLWEHAYYLKYRNRRAEYVEAFFNLIQWKKVSALLTRI